MATKNVLIEGADYDAMHELFQKMLRVLENSYNRIEAYDAVGAADPATSTPEQIEAVAMTEKLRLLELRNLTALVAECRQILRDLSSMRAQDVMVKNMLMQQSKRFTESAATALLSAVTDLVHAANQGQNITPMLLSLRDRDIERFFKDAAITSLSTTLKDAKISS